MHVPKILHAYIKGLRICANNIALEDFVIKNFSAYSDLHVCKNFHVSIKDLCICANNPALEDFVIQNLITIRNFCAYTKSFHVSTIFFRIRVYAQKIHQMIIIIQCSNYHLHYHHLQ